MEDVVIHADEVALVIEALDALNPDSLVREEIDRVYSRLCLSKGWLSQAEMEMTPAELNKRIQEVA